MRVEYHPAVERDVAEALRRYDSVSERLGDEFKAELRREVAAAARNPNRFRPIKPGFHRANLKRFPYHFIYRALADGIRRRDSRHIGAASWARAGFRHGACVRLCGARGS